MRAAQFVRSNGIDICRALSSPHPSSGDTTARAVTDKIKVNGARKKLHNHKKAIAKEPNKMAE